MFGQILKPSKMDNQQFDKLIKKIEQVESECSSINSNTYDTDNILKEQKKTNELLQELINLMKKN